MCPAVTVLNVESKHLLARSQAARRDLNFQVQALAGPCQLASCVLIYTVTELLCRDIIGALQWHHSAVRWRHVRLCWKWHCVRSVVEVALCALCCAVRSCCAVALLSPCCAELVPSALCGQVHAVVEVVRHNTSWWFVWTHVMQCSASES